MENKKFTEAIFQRLDYLTAMASPKETDMEALKIELNDIAKKLKIVNNSISMYSLTEDDYVAAKSKDQLRLTSKNSELNELKQQAFDIEEKLLQAKNEIIALIDEESKVSLEKADLNSQVMVFNEYDSNSREFKIFVNDNVKSIENLETFLEKIKLDKKRVENSITLLSDEQQEINKLIESLESEINIIEEKLSSNEAYNDSIIFRDKNRIKQNYINEKEELENRRAEIKSSPLYLSYKIKENIKAKKDKDNTILMLNQIFNNALEQPYMSVIIRNNSTELDEKYRMKKKEREALSKKISTTNYSLSILPVEKLRTESLDQLINTYNEQIDFHKQIIRSNKMTINSLARQVKSLEEDYKKQESAVTDYINNFDQVTLKQQAAKKREYEKMQTVLTTIKDKIKLYKQNIVDLIGINQEEDKIIESLKTYIKACNMEISEILNTKLTRSNYYDVIRQNKDQEQLAAMDKDLNYLENRLKYRNYNLIQLKNEIMHGIRSTYDKKKENKEEIIIKKVPEIEKTDIKITALDELLPKKSNTEKVSKEEVKNSIDSFETSLKKYYPEKKDAIDNLSKINIKEIIKKEKSKPTTSRTINISDLDILNKMAPFNISLSQKKKVVDIQPLIQEQTIQTDDQNDKRKVISIEPLVKEEIEVKKEPLNMEEIFNLVYKPFEAPTNISRNIAA